jgi:transcription antitermination protein NusB
MRQVFKRRIVRERVLQVLYAYEMSKENLDFLEKEIMIDIPDKIDEDFAHDLVNRVLIHCDDFDKMIKQRVNNWEMNRIALIDKILLRMGICELLYFPDIPPKVSINEVIEIAKVFSTAGSGKFINGILDAVLSELKNSGNLNKTGRGLLEESIRQSDSPKK